MECNPVLVETYRGSTVESFNRGVYCVIDENGAVKNSAGNIHQLTSPRSSLKFFQQIPLVESGAVEHFGLTTEELAVTCGSHNGEESHANVVSSILKKIGLSEADLQCGPQMPSMKRDRIAFYKQGLEASPIRNNCSGKHAGFLALAKYWGVETDSYLASDHPVQQAVRKTVATMHEIREAELEPALDGCSAPIYAMPVWNLATGYKNLVAGNPAHPHAKACNQLINAVKQYPDMLAGQKRYCTQLIRELNGAIIGKTGADGVYSMVDPQKGWGATVKIDDGQMGPQYRVAQKLIYQFSGEKVAEDSLLKQYLESSLKNLAGWEYGKVKLNEKAF